jgi:hypothetical protein
MLCPQIGIDVMSTDDKNVKACFVTAYELYYESLKQKFPKLEVGCFIRKPTNMEDLVKRVKRTD